jgi:succinate dehydrogenase/fumarate reductase-like Fe-S protein
MMHQQNGMALQTFIEEKDLVMDWQAHITKLQEEQNALQESKAEEVSVQEQAESSEETIEAPVEEES